MWEKRGYENLCQKDTLSVCTSFIGRRVFGVSHDKQAYVKRVKSQCRIVFIALEALKY